MFQWFIYFNILIKFIIYSSYNFKLFYSIYYCDCLEYILSLNNFEINYVVHRNENNFCFKVFRSTYNIS